MNESINQYFNRAAPAVGPGPFDYDCINAVENLFKPQTVKVKNTLIYQYFFRYYLEEIFNLFEFSGVPEEWDMNYFRAVLYCTGKIAAIQAAPYGWIPQDCHFGPGRNVYGFPTSVLICNPYFHPADNKIEYDIAAKNTLIKLNPVCMGIANIAAFYAYKKACIAPVVENSALISRNGWILAVSGKAESQTMRTAIEKILSGEIVATIRERDYTAGAAKELSFTPFETDATKHYLVTEALADMRTVDDMFHAALGMGTINRSKKERTITSEQQTENDACRGNVEVWLESLEKSFDQLADRSSGAVRITVKEKYEGEAADGGYSDSVNNSDEKPVDFKRVLSAGRRGA